MDKIVINASKREVIGKKVGALRREGKLPAVIYGKGIDPTPITLDLREASKILSTLTSSSILTLNVDGKEYPALVRDKQRDYLKARYLHIDFLAVSLTEKIRTTITISIEGEAPAVSDYNGVVVSGLSEIEVECLPGDLEERITVDISSLKEIGDSILVKDLAVGKKIDVLSDPDDIIVSITSQAVSAEATTEEDELFGDESSMDEPEVIERGKKEDEEED